jgi:hypothetical protein
LPDSVERIGYFDLLTLVGEFYRLYGAAVSYEDPGEEPLPCEGCQPPWPH